jgi:hypothetical protein
LSFCEKLRFLSDFFPIPLLAKKFNNSMAVVKLGILQ